MSEALADVAVDQLVIDGQQIKADLSEALLDAVVERTIDGADTLQLIVNDPERKLTRSPIFTGRVTANVDGRLFVYVRRSKQGDIFTATFEQAEVWDLRQRKGVRSAAAGTSTRTRFAELLVREVGYLAFEGQPGETSKVQLARGSEDDPKEDTHSALRRLADDRDWRYMVVDGRVLFGSDAWLYARRPALTVRESDDGIDSIDDTFDTGGDVSEGTITCRAERWKIPPGQPLVVADLGVADGPWLVKAIRRSLYSTAATVAITRKQPELPEPKESSSSSGTGPAVGDVPLVSYPTEGNAPGNTAKGTTGGPRNAKGWAWPVSGATISSEFSPSRNGKPHEGIDIAAVTGTAVKAAKAGIVRRAGWSETYGNVVYLEHEPEVVTRYAHMSRLTCRVGQRVAAGEQLGLVGSTGSSSGPHLHFEYRVHGRAVNPRAVLPPLARPARSVM